MTQISLTLVPGHLYCLALHQQYLSNNSTLLWLLLWLCWALLLFRLYTEVSESICTLMAYYEHLCI